MLVGCAAVFGFVSLLLSFFSDVIMLVMIGSLIVFVPVMVIWARFTDQLISYVYRVKNRVWLQAITNYHSLHYCHMCNGIFIPGTELVPVSRVDDLLYRPP
jgi:hypothetical protein